MFEKKKVGFLYNTSISKKKHSIKRMKDGMGLELTQEQHSQPEEAIQASQYPWQHRPHRY
jgi:hypothetical protein